jgi:porin
VQDGRLPIAGPLTQPAPGGTPADMFPEENTTEDSTWAFFYNFDQTLVEDPADPERGWGLFGRFGVADDKTNAVHQFYSIGLGGHRLFPSRPRDRFGIGYYYLKLSDEVDLVPIEDDEQGLEMFYTVAVLPSVDITADLQVIDGAALRADTAVVGAIRMQFRF